MLPTSKKRTFDRTVHSGAIWAQEFPAAGMGNTSIARTATPDTGIVSRSGGRGVRRASATGGERCRGLSRRAERLAHTGAREQRARLPIGGLRELPVECSDRAESARNPQAHDL